MDEPFGARWVSFFPHGDEVVLGSSADEHAWSMEPDPALGEEIVRRCAEVDPRLGQARVVEYRVGLRPARPVVRLDEEPLGASRCVHCYGHGGSGVALSWGCARQIGAMLINR